MVKHRAHECAHCHKMTATPQQHTVLTPVPYKQNGWIGSTWIPYERKYKRIDETKIWLCGQCYAWEIMADLKNGGEDVTELQEYLAQLAKAEREVTASDQTDSHDSTHGDTNHATKSVASLRRRLSAHK